MRTNNNAHSRDRRERDNAGDRRGQERQEDRPQERHEPLDAAGLGRAPLDWEHYAESRLHDFARR